MDKTFVLISCELGKENDVYSQLSEHAQVSNVLITYGEYDLVAEIQSDTPSATDEFVSSTMRKFHNIRSTVTLKVTA